MKAVFCHNRRNKKIDGVIRDQDTCRNTIGFFDETVDHSEIKYCATCRTFIQITKSGESIIQENVDKRELDFKNRLNPSIKRTQIKFTGEGRRLYAPHQ